jgi:UDP-N-acetylglucosamine--N-acetylmuramyl-(pentapeptide) pyrophosphoryl-undecaprenol N-acetylglucosamine transferase
VLGRTNRLVAGGASSLALSFRDTSKVSRRAAARAVVTGNPVREEIAALATRAYPAVGPDSIFRVLVLGGSQGARILSDVVPAALAMMPGAARKRFQVTQQCREEDMQRVRRTYDEAGIAAEVGTFFEDMPERLQWTHFVISRAGASTISELTAAGRPSILVPLAIATDDHQTTNASALVAAGGAWLFSESEFTPAALAKRVQKLALKPDALTRAAAATRAVGKPDATRLLADLVVEAALSGREQDQAMGASDKSDRPSEGQSRRVAA